MSRFTTKTNQIRESAADVKLTCKTMKSIDQTMLEIASTLSIETENSEKIKRQLKVIHDMILDEAVKMDSLADALLHTAELYERTEKKIINNKESNTLVDTNSSGEGGVIGWISGIQKEIRAWFVEHGFIKPKKQERQNGEDVNEHQQKEQDLYMQSEINRLNKDTRYSKKTWKNASAEQRKEILNDYIKEVAAIMGLNIAYIDFFYSESENGYTTMGYYSSGDDSVHINEWVIEVGDSNGFSSYSLFSTVVHELRHAYQYAACNNPEKFVATEETIQKWRESFDNYKSQGKFMEEGMSEEEAYKAYRDQEVERDARNFAGQS